MVMNLKETIISSFFFHLILLLLMTAISNYTTGFSGGIQKIITLDLAMQDSTEQSAAQSNSEAEQPLESAQPFDDAISLLDQVMSTHPEESVAIPEPQKIVEPAADPMKIEKAEKPAIQREGFASLEAYYQFIILHKKIFSQKAGARVNELIGEALKDNRREFYGGTAIVTLTFGSDGQLNEVKVDSASPPLKDFLDEINWGIIPAPASYSLGFTVVQIQIAVHEGFMRFNINPR
jgi:hypothetical protein